MEPGQIKQVGKVGKHHYMISVGSIMSSSSEESLANHKRNLLNCDDELDASLDQNPGASGSGGLDSKQKMLIKKGKMAVAANRKINKAEIAIRRMRKR